MVATEVREALLFAWTLFSFNELEDGDLLAFGLGDGEVINDIKRLPPSKRRGNNKDATLSLETAWEAIEPRRGLHCAIAENGGAVTGLSLFDQDTNATATHVLAACLGNEALAEITQLWTLINSGEVIALTHTDGVKNLLTGHNRSRLNHSESALLTLIESNNNSKVVAYGDEYALVYLTKHQPELSDTGRIMRFINDQATVAGHAIERCNGMNIQNAQGENIVLSSEIKDAVANYHNDMRLLLDGLSRRNASNMREFIREVRREQQMIQENAWGSFISGISPHATAATITPYYSYRFTPDTIYRLLTSNIRGA